MEPTAWVLIALLCLSFAAVLFMVAVMVMRGDDRLNQRPDAGDKSQAGSQG